MRAALVAALVAAVIVSAGPAVAAPRAPVAKGCPAEIGARRASDLAAECRRVRDVRGACRPDLSCDALRAEIRHGCEDAGGDAPAFCELQADTDDAEDE